MVVRLNHEGTTGRGHSRGSLIQSPWTFCFFILYFFNESASTLTGLTGFQSCSETQPACMLDLMCRIGGPGAHLALRAGTPSSYQANIP